MDVVAYLPADPSAAEPVQVGEGAFRDPALGAHQTGAVSGAAAGNPWLHAEVPDQAAVLVVVVAAVREDHVRATPRPAVLAPHGRYRLKQRDQLDDVVAVAAGQGGGERNRGGAPVLLLPTPSGSIPRADRRSTTTPTTPYANGVGPNSQSVANSMAFCSPHPRGWSHRRDGHALAAHDCPRLRGWPLAESDGLVTDAMLPTPTGNIPRSCAARTTTLPAFRSHRDSPDSGHFQRAEAQDLYLRRKSPTHQDPDQERANSTSRQAFSLISVARKQSDSCTTSRPRTRWHTHDLLLAAIFRASSAKWHRVATQHPSRSPSSGSTSRTAPGGLAHPRASEPVTFTAARSIPPTGAFAQPLVRPTPDA